MNYLKFNTLYIEVTHSCNQNCKHCYLDCSIAKEKMPMSLEQIKDILLSFKLQGGRKVIVTGGEPFVRKDIFDILDYLEELQLYFDLASNSLAMTNERLARIIQYKYLSSYFTSLLGATKEKHKFISNQDSFDKVLKSIQYLNDRGISTYVQVTLALDYLSDINAILKLLIPYDKCVIKFTPIASMGIKGNIDKSLIVPKEYYKNFLDSIKKSQQKYPGRIDNSNILNYEDLELAIKDYQDEELWSLCYKFIAVRPNGDMSFSTELGDPYIWGKAYKGFNIPIDGRLEGYIQKLKHIDKYLLEKAKKEDIEYGVELVEELKRLA